MRLVIATPSPFARKARIALLEKGVSHELVVQNPWQSAIADNPLGKVPVLYLDDGGIVHDSSVIVEYLETRGKPPPLLPSEAHERVMHRQVEAIADDTCDAAVLIVTERARPPARQSTAWIARQAGKLPRALDELEQRLGGRESFTAHGFGLAEIATGCALGYLDLRYAELDWRKDHPRLARLATRLGERSSFAATRPSAQPVAIG
jgi:glutathione S-transferase